MHKNDFENIHLQWFADDDTDVKDVDATQTPDATDTKDNGNNKLDIELIEKQLDNEEFKNKLLNLKAVKSFIDSKTSKGIETFKTNYDLKIKENIDIEVEKLYAQRHPGEDPKDKLIRQANENAEKALKMQKVANVGKHLLAKSTELGVKLNEKLIDMIATFGEDEGELVLQEFAKARMDGIEEGKNRIINKHAKIPQTGDSVNTDIADVDLIQAWKTGKITQEEYQRRVSKTTRR